MGGFNTTKGYTPAYLCIGQSNTVGISSESTDRVSTRDDASIKIYSMAGSDPDYAESTSGWETLSSYTDASASERSFLRRLHSLGSVDAVVVKYGANGKGLQSWFNNVGYGWDEIENTVNAAVTSWSGKPLRFEGVLWVQGQRDSLNESGAADNYEANLSAIMTRLRTLTGNPNLKFISPQHPPAWSTQPYASTVRAAVTTFGSSNDFAVTFDASDTASRDGGIHYDTDSFEIMGKRMAEAYIANF